MFILSSLKHKFSEIYYKLYNCFISFKYRGILENRSANLHNIIIQNCGKGNLIIIKRNSIVKECKFKLLGSNNRVVIEDSCKIKNVEFYLEDNDSSIYIGSHCTFEGESQFAACEGKKIVIGNDCMFSHNISIRTTDSHSIINDSGCRINPAADIIIGNHVWVGISSYILKGSLIGDNVIIAANTTVTSSSSNHKNIILAGIPAKIIKENINWLRRRI